MISAIAQKFRNGFMHTEEKSTNSLGDMEAIKEDLKRSGNFQGRKGGEGHSRQEEKHRSLDFHAVIRK